MGNRNDHSAIDIQIVTTETYEYTISKSIGLINRLLKCQWNNSYELVLQNLRKFFHPINPKKTCQIRIEMMERNTDAVPWTHLDNRSRNFFMELKNVPKNSQLCNYVNDLQGEVSISGLQVELIQSRGN